MLEASKEKTRANHPLIGTSKTIGLVKKSNNDS